MFSFIIAVLLGGGSVLFTYCGWVVEQDLRVAEQADMAKRVTLYCACAVLVCAGVGLFALAIFLHSDQLQLSTYMSFLVSAGLMIWACKPISAQKRSSSRLGKLLLK